MFADDASVFNIVNKYISLCAAKMNKDLDCINNWAVQWLVFINATKTFLCFLQPKYPALSLTKTGNSDSTPCVLS